MTHFVFFCGNCMVKGKHLAKCKIDVRTLASYCPCCLEVVPHEYYNMLQEELTVQDYYLVRK